MRSASIQTAFAVVALAFGGMTGVAGAAEITVLSSIGLQSVLEDLAPKFENSSGHKLSLTFGLAGPFAKRVQDGEAVDILVAPRGFIDGLIKANRLEPNSETNLARSSVGVAVRKGAPKPDISTPDAVRRTLRNAKSIVSVDPEQGSVGGAVLLTLDKLGITQELKPKITWVPTGGVVQDAVAKGEYEIAFGPYLSDMRNPGLDVVGALPPAASTPVDITGFLSTSVKDPKAARALLDYLSSPEVAPVYESAKIFPVR